MINTIRTLALLAALLPGSVPGQQLRVAWQVPLAAPSFGGAAVADVDRDGRLEVAFGTYFGDNSVRLLNGEDGSQAWRLDLGYACVDASLRFADLNQDGWLELVVPISNKGYVLALDAASGKQIWRYHPQPRECTDSPPAILDIDNDGRQDVVYGTFKGRLHVIDGSTGLGKRRIAAASPFIQTGPLVVDLNDDGHRDFVCATFKGDNCVHANCGRTGRPLWTFKVPGKHVGMYHGCAVGDVNGDGQPELTIGAYDGRVYCLDRRGQLRWQTKVEPHYIMSPTVLHDVDRDGANEVLVAGSRISMLNNSGKVVWSRPAGIREEDSVTRGVSLADLDGDGQLDVASLSGAGHFQVLRAKNGETLFEFDASKLGKQPARDSSHGVTIADLTGDGALDVFFVVGASKPRHGLAVCLTGFPGKGRGWYMLRHDLRNTGNPTTELPATLRRSIEELPPVRKRSFH